MPALHRLGRRGRRAVFVPVALLAGLALGTGTSSGAASAPASCMGHEASNISPPGASEEFPGGMPALRAFIAENFPGVPPGAVYREIAKLHEGSHEACDEALEAEE